MNPTSALGFLADLGFLPAREGAVRRWREGSCGHGIIKLTLVGVVRIIVERKRMRGDGEIEGTGAVLSRSV